MITRTIQWDPTRVCPHAEAIQGELDALRARQMRYASGFAPCACCGRDFMIGNRWPKDAPSRCGPCGDGR
jgi:hypothetical protein